MKSGSIIKRGVLAVVMGLMILFCCFFGIGDLANGANEFQALYTYHNCEFLTSNYTQTEI